MSSPTSRKASHAGSWYSRSARELSQQLGQWLNEANRSVEDPVRAIISPHAGYSYSGATAAHAFVHVKAEGIRRVFILGPSHHYYLSGCAVTGCDVYETPVGNLTVDRQITQDLLSTGKFEVMSAQADEAEHSIEMQLPYIAKVMGGGAGFTVVPILVGSLDKSAEEAYGRLLAPYLDDPSCFFVISSDFCHWAAGTKGAVSVYQPYDASRGAIHEYIRWLDHVGMQLIESQDATKFHEYLKREKNTICGRHPIAVLMHMLQTRREARAASGSSSSSSSTTFVSYAQSGEVMERGGSSVSYAAAAVRLV